MAHYLDRMPGPGQDGQRQEMPVPKLTTWYCLKSLLWTFVLFVSKALGKIHQLGWRSVNWLRLKDGEEDGEAGFEQKPPTRRWNSVLDQSYTVETGQLAFARPPDCGDLISKRQDLQGVTLPAYTLAAGLRAVNKQERTGPWDKESTGKGAGCVEKGNVPFPFAWALTVHGLEYRNTEPLNTNFP